MASVRRRSSLVKQASRAMLSRANRPASSLSTMARQADAAMECWHTTTAAPASGRAMPAELQRAASTISLTGPVGEDEGEGEFLKQVLKSGKLEGLHKACAQGNNVAVVSIVKIDSERQGQLGYEGLNANDVYGRCPLMYAAVADSKPCLDMLLTCGARREVADPEGHTAVHYAAFYGKHRALKFLIEAAADWSARDKYGRTPLHTATYPSSTKCLQVLLRHCSVVHGDVDMVDNENMTALHTAAHACRPQHISLLVKAGANPAAVDIEGKTALHWTISNTEPSCVLVLYQAHPEIVNKRDIHSHTALHIASELGMAHITEALCELDRCDIDIKDRNDRTPLHLAVIGGHQNCVHQLLAHGALDACIDAHTLSPLHYAVQRGNMDVLFRFCKASSLGNLPDSDGRRPLHWAVTGRNAHIVRMLMSHDDLRREVDVEDKQGVTALRLAVENNLVDCATELLAAGTDPNSTSITEFHEPTLFFACEDGKAECVELMLQQKGDPNLVSSEGQPCLHAAIRGHHVDVLKSLLVHHATANCLDKEGATPLQLAAYLGFPEAAELLLSFSAEADIQHETTGYTALHLAAMEGHSETMAALLRYGAAPNMSDYSEERWTALDHAYNNDHTNCVEVLTGAGGLTMDDICYMAATIIQASVRGLLARKKMAWISERKRAALLLQKYIRGYLARKYSKQLKRRRNAAVLIQKHWRGYHQYTEYQKALNQLHNMQHHDQVIFTLHQQLVSLWQREGVRQADPQPAVVKREWMFKRMREPPKPRLMPPPDPVKPLHRELASESAAQRAERLERERKQRIEMALARRDHELNNQEIFRQFCQDEERRRNMQLEEKVHKTMRGILEESQQRHKHSVKKMQHTWHMRSVLNAVLLIQHHFRAWQRQRKMQPLIEREEVQRRHRERWAATVIQRAWRNYHGRKRMQSAKRLLRSKQTHAILRMSRHDWKYPLPSYGQKTLISGKSRRKLIPSNVSENAALQNFLHGQSLLRSQQVSRADGLAPLSPRRQDDGRQKANVKKNSDSDGKRTSDCTQLQGAKQGPHKHGMKANQAEKLQRHRSTGSIANKNLRQLPDEINVRSASRRWRLPSLPVLPSVGGR